MDKIEFRFMVTSKKLDKIPDYRIVDNVKRNDLTVKTLFFQDEKKKKKTSEIQERFIKLYRMKQLIEFNSCGTGIFTSKFNTPRDRTFRSITTSCTEAAQSS